LNLVSFFTEAAEAVVFGRWISLEKICAADEEFASVVRRGMF